MHDSLLSAFYPFPSISLFGALAKKEEAVEASGVCIAFQTNERGPDSRLTHEAVNGHNSSAHR